MTWMYSPETRKKLSDSQKGIRLGKKLSEETKQKIRLGRTGKKHTEETKNKIGLGVKKGLRFGTTARLSDLPPGLTEAS